MIRANVYSHLFVNRIVGGFIGLLMTMLLVGCDSDKLPPLAGNDTILAFGDSLTEGKGVTPANSYPSVLARLSRLDVVNAGISGEITADGLERLPTVLDEVNPKLMVLLHGGNDILRNMDITQTRHNLSRMIELARSRDIQVVMVGVPEKSLFSDSAQIYVELAEQHQLVFIDDIIASLIRSPSKKSDSVHFNNAGYHDLAQAIYDKLDDAGAL